MQHQWPRTLEEAVRITILTMSDEDKDALKNAREEDLILFHHNWAMNMRNEFGVGPGVVYGEAVDTISNVIDTHSITNRV